MEPVVAHPAVDHRAHRRRDLQRRMRVHQGHHHGEALVGAAQHADAAVRLGHVLHQPLDRVVGVGGVIGRRRVQRPAQRAREHVVALRAVLAAHVLEHADVAVGDEHLVALRQRRQHVRRGVAGGATAGVVGRPRHDHRRAAGALGHDDHGEELDPVAHRDHHFAPLVVVAGARGHIGLADVRRAGRRRGGRGRAGGAGRRGWAESAVKLRLTSAARQAAREKRDGRRGTMRHSMRWVDGRAQPSRASAIACHSASSDPDAAGLPARRYQ